LFAILQKYDFSSKSQLTNLTPLDCSVVCDTAKVRFFKQITTDATGRNRMDWLFAILQKYDFSSKSQRTAMLGAYPMVVCDTAKVRFFKQITTVVVFLRPSIRCLRYCKSTIFQANHNFWKTAVLFTRLFAILQKYDFSSKSQLSLIKVFEVYVVCDTAKVRFFKQITTVL